MAYMKMVGGWLYYRNDPAYSGASGYIPIDKIHGIEHGGSTNSFVNIYTGTCSFMLDNTTLDEVMSLIRSETDRTSVEIVSRQADRIAELEQELEKLRDV